MRSAASPSRSGIPAPCSSLTAIRPSLRPETLQRLLAAHASSPRACTLLLGIPADPSGMGESSATQRGTFCASSRRPIFRRANRCRWSATQGSTSSTERSSGRHSIASSTANAQGEYYLTDVVALLTGPVEAVVVPDPDEVLGINDRRQLAAAEAVLRHRTLDALMLAGVTVEDPATTYVDAGVVVGRDSVIHAMTTLRGATRLGAGCEIGPMAILTDVRGGDGVIVGPSHLERCELGDAVLVGSYCRVRPNTVLASGVELGTHAEVKNSTVGAGTRIGHFSCVLDSDVGEAVNIGAGTVTCNYDGEAKHRTTIGNRVFVGTNSTLVAPVRLGDGSYIGAGSFIDQDVPAGALAVGRSRQRNVEGWSARRQLRS